MPKAAEARLRGPEPRPAGPNNIHITQTTAKMRKSWVVIATRFDPQSIGSEPRQTGSFLGGHSPISDGRPDYASQVIKICDEGEIGIAALRRTCQNLSTRL